MATVASDNVYPKIIGAEQASTPAAPSAGQRKLYPKDDGWYDLDDAGVETGPFGAGPGTGTGIKTINAQTGTAYTLALTDGGSDKFLTLTNAAAIALTVPTNASVAFPVGTVVEGAQLGAGQVTIAGASGVTVDATPGLKVAAQYGTFGLLKTGTDTWLAFGRLSA